MKHKLNIYIFIVLMLTLILSGFLYFHKNSTKNLSRTNLFYKSLFNSLADDNYSSIHQGSVNSGESSTNSNFSGSLNIDDVSPKAYIYGNTSSNIMNSSTTAYDGEFIYYSIQRNDYKLYRQRPDGSNISKITDDQASSISVLGDWIYYVNKSGDKGIFKIKKDGTSKFKLCNDIPSSITVVNDYLYYSLSSELELYNIYKIKTNGTDKVKIQTSYDNSLYAVEPTMLVVGDWIYINLFVSGEQKKHLYRIKTDGSTKAKVLDVAPNRFVISNDWIYYINTGNRDIYKCKLDGTSITPVFKSNSSQLSIYSINIYNNYLYLSSDVFSSSLEYRGLYKIKLNGSDLTKLTSMGCSYLNVSGGWIFFEGITEQKRTSMRIKLNGSEESEFK